MKTTTSLNSLERIKSSLASSAERTTKLHTNTRQQRRKKQNDSEEAVNEEFALSFQVPLETVRSFILVENNPVTSGNRVREKSR